MTEIQGKSILVRVSVRFELASVQVIGSRLYLYLAKLLSELKADVHPRCIARPVLQKKIFRVV